MPKRPRIADEPASRGGGSVRKDPDMFKRPCLGRCSSRTAAARPAQQHLYLVVDDWERGYSIYRVGEDDFDSDADAAMDARPAASPLVRVEAQHPYSWSFAGHGTKILAMQPSESSPGFPVFDTETLGVTVCPYPPTGRPLPFKKPVYISVGGRLLAMVYSSVGILGPEPAPTEKPWSWTSVEEPAPPFQSRLVTGYAVHPDGRTVFVSAKGAETESSFEGDRNSTFAFDMERAEWTYLGEWLLPFKGQACYDGELDAWVGLCMYKEGAGRVCCCDVPPAAGPGSETMPIWKLGKDVLFNAGSKRHIGATLVYMGDSRFCLVECRSHKDCSRSQRLRVVKMTAVVLKYDKEGNLRTAQNMAYASMSYQVAHERIDMLPNPVAFWM